MKNVEIELLFNGRPAKQHSKDGRLFLEARENSQYSIQIQNNNSYRIEAIVGVDGINVISGKNNTKESPSYVIDKYDKIVIDGYRISDNEVARFKFAKRGNSYASGKSDNPQNGIISVVSWAEKEKPQEIYETVVIKKKVIIEEEPYYIPKPKPWDWPYTTKPWTTHIWGPIFTCGENSGLQGRISNDYSSGGIVSSSIIKCCDNISNEFIVPTKSVSNNFTLGSSFGEVKESKVIKVEFSRGKSLGEFNIYYTDRQSLMDMGIELIKTNKINYPLGITEYCSAPSGWKR